jgi:transcriptional regulator of acetoin/glycerol metabolism
LHKLSEHDGNVSKAADAMGVDRSHLYRKMKIWESKRGIIEAGKVLTQN